MASSSSSSSSSSLVTSKGVWMSDVRNFNYFMALIILKDRMMIHRETTYPETSENLSAWSRSLYLSFEGASVRSSSSLIDWMRHETHPVSLSIDVRVSNHLAERWNLRLGEGSSELSPSVYSLQFAFLARRIYSLLRHLPVHKFVRLSHTHPLEAHDIDTFVYCPSLSPPAEWEEPGLVKQRHVGSFLFPYGELFVDVEHLKMLDFSLDSNRLLQSNYLANLQNRATSSSMADALVEKKSVTHRTESSSSTTNATVDAPPSDPSVLKPSQLSLALLQNGDEGRNGLSSSERIKTHDSSKVHYEVIGTGFEQREESSNASSEYFRNRSNSEPPRHDKMNSAGSADGSWHSSAGSNVVPIPVQNIHTLEFAFGKTPNSFLGSSPGLEGLRIGSENIPKFLEDLYQGRESLNSARGLSHDLGSSPSRCSGFREGVEESMSRNRVNWKFMRPLSHHADDSCDFSDEENLGLDSDTSAMMFPMDESALFPGNLSPRSSAVLSGTECSYSRSGMIEELAFVSDSPTTPNGISPNHDTAVKPSHSATRALLLSPDRDAFLGSFIEKCDSVRPLVSAPRPKGLEELDERVNSILLRRHPSQAFSFPS